MFLRIFYFMFSILLWNVDSFFYSCSSKLDFYFLWNMTLQLIHVVLLKRTHKRKIQFNAFQHTRSRVCKRIHTHSPSHSILYVEDVYDMCIYSGVSINDSHSHFVNQIGPNCESMSLMIRKKFS